jgi:dihydrofolate reductase
MKVILVFVSSLDGKVTRWNDPLIRNWTSQADKNHFNKIWNDSPLVVMGSSTFDVDRFSALPDHLFVVMTREPARYKAYEKPGKLEFSDLKPAELAKHFEKKGFDTMMLVGGAHVSTSFLKEKMLDEIWLTIEPKIFGVGTAFVTEEKFDVDLQLISVEKINEAGTLLTKYSVMRGSKDPSAL